MTEIQNTVSTLQIKTLYNNLGSMSQWGTKFPFCPKNFEYRQAGRTDPNQEPPSLDPEIKGDLFIKVPKRPADNAMLNIT